MKQRLQNKLLGLAISLLLCGSTVSADTQIPEDSEVEYHHYNAFDPEGQKYHPFLTDPVPEKHIYHTPMKATANINNTPEKETIVLIVADTSDPPFNGKWSQAFLIIAEAEGEAALPKRIDAFKLFDTDLHTLDVPAKTIGLHNPPFIFTQPPKDAQTPHTVSFRLVDLTGDGILDIWLESEYAVAVISFQDTEFKEIFSSYTLPMDYKAEHVDLDNDGTYEIQIPYSVQIKRVSTAAYPEWMSLYEWDGNAYVLNNERLYTDDNEILIQLLSLHNQQLIQHGEFISVCETYHFYLGLAHYYRGSTSSARWDLEWIVKYAEKQDYIQVAETLLKELTPDQK